MNSSIWLKNPLAILCEANAGGGLLIRDQKIVELVPKGQAPSEQWDEVFDASEHVIIPGLVNCHHHFYQTLTRCLPAALDKALFPWLKSLYPVWAGLTPELLGVATRLALAELMLSGCTTAADHHYLFPKGLENAIDVQVDAAKAMGIRVCLTRGSMSLGTDDGGLPPQHVVQSEAEILADCERVAKQYHDSSEGSFVQIALAPCSPFSVSTELMKDSSALAQQQNLLLHTHLAETLDEEEFCLKRFGLRTVDYLESVNWLNRRTWLAHGIHFDDSEVQRLGQAGVGICHCPSSNMVLASGICRVSELEDMGSPVGIGVDGSASNDCSNLMLEARQALLLQRLRYGAEKVSHHDALRWATQGGANLLKRDDIGRIEVGKQADLAFFRPSEERFSGSHDHLAALVLCGADRVDRLMIGGQWRVIDKNILGLDIEALKSEHRRAAKTLVAANGE